MDTIVAWLLIVLHSVTPFFAQVKEYITQDVAPVAISVQEKIEDTIGIVASTSLPLPVATTVKAVIERTVPPIQEMAQKKVSVPVAKPTTTQQVTQKPLALSVEGVLAQANAQRYKAGLPLLRNNEDLAKMAEVKAHDMIARNYFAHESPTGKNVGELAEDQGYDYLSVGENLAFGGFENNTKLVDAWMNSPGHRANIMSNTYTEIGIAVMQGELNGKKGWFAVQEFGLPKSVCPAPSSTVRSTLETLKAQIAVIDKKLQQKNDEIDGMSRNDPDYPKAVAEYNSTVAARNELVNLYTKEAKVYNNQVETYTACTKKILNK